MAIRPPPMFGMKGGAPKATGASIPMRVEHRIGVQAPAEIHW